MVNGVMKGWKRHNVNEAYGEMQRMIIPLGGWESPSKVKEKSPLEVLTHSR